MVSTHLLSSDAHVVLNISEDCGLNEISSVSMTTTSSNELRSFLLSDFDHAQNLIELLLIDLRSLLAFGVEWTTNYTLLCPLDTSLHKLIVDALLYESSGSSAANLTLNERNFYCLFFLPIFE